MAEAMAVGTAMSVDMAMYAATTMTMAIGHDPPEWSVAIMALLNGHGDMANGRGQWQYGFKI